MLAEMAAEDIRALEARGVKLTPAQIVRLNDLARRVTRGGEAADFVCAPRVAWAGSTPFYEPSISAEIWMRDFAAHWWCGRSLVVATAFMSAHGNRAGGFWRARDNERAARRELERWQRTLDCTWPQLLRALDYALNGIVTACRDGMEAGGDAQEGGGGAAGGDAAPEGCPYADVLADAVAAGLGVGVGDLERLPVRVVIEYVRRWTRNQIALAGGRPDAANARERLRDWCAYDDYVKALEGLAEGGGNG